MPGAAASNIEIGAAAGQCKTGNRERGNAIVGADRGAVDARGRVVRSDRGIAIGGLRAAEACRPYTPALLEHRRWRLGKHRIGVTLGGGGPSGPAGGSA